MEQKKVKILSFRAENHNIIKAVVLTPDIMSKKLIQLVGESGNGKSTLLEMLQTATAGVAAIKKKDILENGYLSEVLLLDGDIKIYAGAKVTQYQKGGKKGENKFETYLYAKDADGKQYQPLIDGVAATAGKYVEMLTTELTFNMAALFSENQTTHRQLIEKLYKPELEELGADKVVADILAAKKHRDACRTMCQGSGSYLERFKEEGLDETMLAALRRQDVVAINEKITQKRIELDRIVNGSDTAYELAVAKIKAEREKQLQVIKDDVIDIREKIRDDNDKKQADYDKLRKEYDYFSKKEIELSARYKELYTLVEEIISVESRTEINILINKDRKEQMAEYNCMLPIIALPDKTLAANLTKRSADYLKLEKTPLDLPEKGVIDTTKIDAEISKLDTEKKSAIKINALCDRFDLWQSWIEAQHKYEKLIDVLRAMYQKIDCGVEGMHIVPVETESGRIEVWIQYDGSYDIDFFHPGDKKIRMQYLFQYSSFQRAAIGVLLQAARLNLKPKALRLAIVDDVAFTNKGLEVLNSMCEKLDIQLITSRTDDYDKKEIGDDEIIVEGGEVFFNKKA